MPRFKPMVHVSGGWRMLNLLSRGRRWRAALQLAIVYALTVLSPAIANAIAVGPVEASHHHGLRSAAHSGSSSHQAHAHDHAGQHDHAHHDDGGTSKSTSNDLQCC